MKQSVGKIQRLTLRKFTAFEEAVFDFCPGINVLIGTNSTGKTLTLKLMYAMLKAARSLGERTTVLGDVADILLAKLQGVFQLQQLTDLFRIQDGERHDKFEARLEYADTAFDLTLERTLNEQGAPITKMTPTLQFLESLSRAPSPLYLPSQEILSINRGFLALYQHRELPYDETFYDLSLALNAVPLRKEKLKEMLPILSFLRDLLGGKNGKTHETLITQENDQFYFNLPEGRFETHLVAEGYRKIATLLYLLENGGLTSESILLWDEPEANLNPKIIVHIVDVLKKLAMMGMQIFVTTHDYLLSHELSLSHEYQANARPDMAFFSFSKPDPHRGVMVESGATLADIAENPILEEFAAHYDREAELFQHANP